MFYWQFPSELGRVIRIVEGPSPCTRQRQAPPLYTSPSPPPAPTPRPNLPIVTTQGSKETFLTLHNLWQLVSDGCSNRVDWRRRRPVADAVQHRTRLRSCCKLLLQWMMRDETAKKRRRRRTTTVWHRVQKLRRVSDVLLSHRMLLQQKHHLYTTSHRKVYVPCSKFRLG